MRCNQRFVVIACLALALWSVGCAPYRTMPKSDLDELNPHGAAWCDSLETGTLVNVGLKSGENIVGKMIRVTAHSVTVEQAGRRQYKEVVVARLDIATMSVARGPSEAAVTTVTVLGLLAAFVVVIGAATHGGLN